MKKIHISDISKKTLTSICLAAAIASLTACGGGGNSAKKPVKTADIANDKSAQNDFATAVTINVLSNDSVDGDKFDVESVELVAVKNTKELVVEGEGRWAVNIDGSITFTPEIGFEGNPTPVKYTVKDTNGKEAKQPATITILYKEKPVKVTKLIDTGMQYTVRKNNNDTCIEDANTGLMWEMKDNLANSVHNSQNKYTWHVADATINGGNAGKDMSSDETVCFGSDCNTQAFISKLNEGSGYCGYNDWRLPSRGELQSVIDYVKDEKPAIDNLFGDTETNFYWTATTYPSSAKKAYALGFGAGVIQFTSKSYKRHVRAVRGEEMATDSSTAAQYTQENCLDTSIPSSAPNTRYKLSADGKEVTDTLSDLVWQRCPIGQQWDGFACSGTAVKDTWSELKKQAEALGNGYRLASVKELSSLVENQCKKPMINQNNFGIETVAVFGGSNYWTGVESAEFNNKAWYVDFGFGKVDINTKESNKHFARAVRAKTTDDSCNCDK